MENKRIWYSIEMSKTKAEAFKEWLRENHIRYEPSECFDLIHFECYMDQDELTRANDWIYFAN